MEPSNEDRPADNGEELPQVGGDELPPTPCRTAHEIWEASRWSFFTTEPVCDSDGYYVNQRCYPLYGYCICIDRNTGVEIESSKLSKPTIDCTDVVAPQPEQGKISSNFCLSSYCTQYYVKQGRDIKLANPLITAGIFIHRGLFFILSIK